MQIEWAVIPRGDVHPSDSRVYVTMNRKGEIVLNGTAYGPPTTSSFEANATPPRAGGEPAGGVFADVQPAEQPDRAHQIKPLRA